MRSKFQLTAAGGFLVCVGAFVLYLSMAPGYVAPPDPPAAAVAPAPEPAPVSPTPAPVVEQSPEPAPPEPAPAPEPEAQPQPEPAPPQPEPESIGDYGSVDGVVTRVTVPVPRVKITAAPDAASGDVTGLATVTDNRGKFKLPRVPVGRATLHITNMGFPGELLQEVLVAKNETVTADIKLPGETATVEGLIHAGGVGLPASVEITMHGEGMEQSKVVNTSDGHYVADNLLPGVIDLIATAENPPGERKVKTDSFSLQPGEFLQKDYSFSAPAFVSGSIAGIEQDERTYVIALYGAVEAGATFGTPEEVADRLAKMTGPDRAGNYRLENLDPGTYTVVVFSMRIPEEGAAPVYQSAYKVVDVADEADVNLDFTIKW
ncbi:MAG: carboxypeptidase-like regulatory domain-containing protein [Candidatus Hydrogenedentes bacterium]|nr:carboxypeptidase-like regulatory domain-containing protein [Candidatus Hydrogenedentota bacterium]